jgi:hypothetical protein
MTLTTTRSAITLGIVLAATALAWSASARATDPFTEAVLNAYPPYRTALFKTNSTAKVEAREAIAQARAAWTQLRNEFGERSLPAPYDHDGKVGAELRAVDAVYAKAADEVEQGQIGRAHETLEKIRDMVAEQRRRNNVFVFSDAMNAYHSEMEHAIDEGGALLGQPDGVLRTMARVGVLSYLAHRLVKDAPPSLAANTEFVELTGGVVKSVAALEAALQSGDVAAAKAALTALKRPYSRLFLKFG